jgi:hypothetical protein
MKKFTLSVPDDLAAKISEWRALLGNLSGIFQEAVAAHITRKEEFAARMKGDTDMEAIIERLRNEKAQLTLDYLKKGAEDGLRWAKAAPYVELEYAARRFEPKDSNGVYDPTVPLHDTHLGHYFIDALETDPRTYPGNDEDELNPFAKEWMKGWVEAVRAFFVEIQDKL